MADNFLKFKPPVTHGHKDMLRCAIRGTVRATPEEMARQSVLHWLIGDKEWPKDNLRLEHSYDYVGDPGRTRIRPDIEVLVNGKVKVVIECKRYDVPLDERVYKQAEEYAFKSGAKWIWATNGKKHRFLKWQDNEWRVVPKLEPLEVSAPQPEKPEIPDECNDKATFKRYLKSCEDTQLLNADKHLDWPERRFVLAMHRMLFGVEKKLPYSHDGVHILEDRGSRWRNFSNASGGSFYTRHAEFIAATSGCVEAVSLAVSPNYIYREHIDLSEYVGLRLCIGVTKPNRSHYALELKPDTTQIEKTGKWKIYHDGRMSRIPNATVMKAVREAGMEKWIDTNEEDTTTKERVYLGNLTESATWRNSKKLLANLIHYAIIRTNLREADAARRKATVR